MKQVLPFAILAAFAATALGAETTYTAGLQEKPKPQKRERTKWGLQVGAYFPADSEIRDLFGDSLLKIGLSPVSQRYEKSFAITPDVTFITAEGNNSRMFIVPVTANLSTGMKSNGLKSFVSVGAGPAYMDYKLRRPDTKGFITFKERTVGWNMNFEAGVLIGERIAIEARYDWFQEMDDFDFSGWTINGNIVLFRW